MGLRAVNNPNSSFEDVFSNTGKEAATNLPYPFTASGGTTATYTDPTGSYQSHTFTEPGSFIVEGEPGTVDYLVVGGGGAGGDGVYASSNGGGGGAGGLLTGTSFAVTVQNYSVTVGYGATGGLAPGTGSGSPSIFSTITAHGGGGGGYNKNATGNPAQNGGSGGGSSSHNTVDGYGNGNREVGTGFAVPTQGNNGGTGVGDAPSWGSGGGGGAGGAGGNASNPTAGAGGIGVNNGYRYGPPTSDHPSAGDIGYAGGGSGSTSGSSGAESPTAAVPYGGGVGVYNDTGTNGVDGKGGGGGGGSGYPTAEAGGNGGSGIVIIRYQT